MVFGDIYTAGNHQYAENILIPSREEKGGFSLGFVLEAVHLRAFCFCLKLFVEF